MYRPFLRLVCLFALITSAPALAGSREVSIQAADGLALKGTWHEPEKPGERAVLLMHAMFSNRGAWAPLLPELLGAGFRVLTVDLRGYGETGGVLDVPAALADARGWLAWMRQQGGVARDRVGVLGASLGGNVGIQLCAADPQCGAVVALSPSGNFSEAMLDFSGRGLMVFAAANDGNSARAVRAMASSAQGDFALRLVEGSAHGIPALFDGERNRLGEVRDWLDQHL
ncbi:alpha/beta fold hydrolase [Niveibacterium sp. SC-1]|uniref:alpha/beta hydrolase n=1 Tax=Niveibacterium sp. SC-1 TaxID=3135646 RepID=UPI00311F8CD3